jgi:hypothetical protein
MEDSESEYGDGNCISTVHVTSSDVSDYITLEGIFPSSKNKTSFYIGPWSEI